MFRRSYDIDYSPEHKNWYVINVLATLKLSPYAIRINDKPYDMFKDRKVKTLHYVIRYDHMHYQSEKVEALRRDLIQR